MLEAVDESLEAFLRASVPLDARDVDVSFEPPERTWSAKLNRPTVNLFLWDIRRSSDRARAGLEEFERDGQVVRRMALPRVELRYLVTVWTADHGDERALLSGLMRAVLANGEIPDTFVPATLAALPPLGLLMARTGEQHVDVFSALEGQLKPAINLMVVGTVDIGVVTVAGPPTRDVSIGVQERTGGSTSPVRRRVAGEVLDAAAVGATVRSPRGIATVNEWGRFLVPADTGDEIIVESDPPSRATVPGVGGVVVP